MNDSLVDRIVGDARRNPQFREFGSATEIDANVEWLFDIITGAGVEDGRKSLAVEVVLQPGEKSFTDEELKAIADNVVAATAKLDGVRCIVLKSGNGFSATNDAKTPSASIAPRDIAARGVDPHRSITASEDHFMAEHAMIDIASPDLRVAINPFGAELTHLHDAEGRELLTDADPAFWTGHAPILFPVVGRTNGDVIRIDGRSYAMRQHGFARRSMFQVERHDADRAVLQLVDDDQSRAVYPFAFLLEIGFTLDGATLLMDARIENRSDGAMPVSFGWHPAFAWPLPYGEPREAHRLTFNADEPGSLKEITQDGLIAEEGRESPLDGRELLLHDALFANDALIWDPVHSSRIIYGAAQGPVLDIAFPATPKLGIWTKPGAHYVCVEPWHGIADPDEYAGEFRDKPGVFEIAPGADWTCSMSVTLVA